MVRHCSQRENFAHLGVKGLRGKPGLERRKLHDIRHSFLGCITYELFQVLLK